MNCVVSLPAGVPQAMRAIVLRETGSADCLQLERVPTPAPGPGEALVRVLASSLSDEDVAIRSGKRAGCDLPRRLGRELAGEVVFLGEGAEGWRPGDKVIAAPPGMGETRDGAYADFAVVPAASLVRLPRGISPVEAVAAVRAFGAAWAAIVDRTAVAEGDHALVLGATGTSAIAVTQLLTWAGARVILIANARPSEDLRRLGAEFVLHAGDGDLADQVVAATSGAGVALAFDAAGPGLWPIALSLLSARGRLIVTERAETEPASVDPLLLARRELSLVGCPSVVSNEAIGRLLALCAEGLLETPLDGFLPLHEAKWGHERMEREPHALPMVLVPA